jgi:hypothetical protein
MKIYFISIEFYCLTEDSAERADVAESQLGKLRAKSRSSVSVNRLSPGVSLFFLFLLTKR